MLQGLREGLKGPTAIVIVVVVVGAMVFYGVDTLFSSSLGGDDVASVNGEEISQRQFQRAMVQQKARLQAQFQLEEGAEQLKDENLRQPTLMNLVRQKALIQKARDNGMGVAEDVVRQEIVEAFKGDKQLIDNYIARYGYTPATFLKEESEIYMIRQLASGLNGSAFVTDKELEVIASISGQKRSFYTMTLPKSEFEEAVNIDAAAVQAYYDSNTNAFMEPEKVSVEYLELLIDDFARMQAVSEEDVKAEYDQEVSGFNGSPEYTVAHILIEDVEAAEKISAVEEALKSDKSFADIAKEFSDDLGSKALGGSLGVMIDDVYEESFKNAVYALAEGSVSGPVETSAGIHFIKLESKVTPEAPTFDERKATIEKRLKRVLASDAFAEALEKLEEFTFSADNLKSAGDELGLEVKESPFFPKSGGLGIGGFPKVASAAFSDDVLVSGRNSPVVEVGPEHAIVVRLKEHKPAQVKPFEQVKEQIAAQLKRERIASELKGKAAEIIAKLRAGETVESVSEQYSYEAKTLDSVERTNLDADRNVMRTVFSMARPADAAPVLETVTLPTGDIAIVGLTKVENGTLDALEEQQLKAMQAQLERQLGMDETSAYQGAVFESAKVAM